MNELYSTQERIKGECGQAGTMDFKHNRIQATSLALLILGLPVSANAQAVTEEPKSARQLQPLIERQQEQLRQQAEQLRLQSQKLDILQQQVNALQRREPDTNSAATTTVTKTQQETASRTGVGFGNERIKLSVSGQVNRAVNSADDGAGARLYFVDNSASGSRIRSWVQGRWMKR